MIKQTYSTSQSSSWQIALAEAVTDPAELCALLELDPCLLPSALAVAEDFALRVPRGFIARMKKGDAQDPLLLQVLPVEKELAVTPHFIQDPLQEKPVNPLPGLLHKYETRVLLTVTGSCAINCRYCFRRHFAYKDNNPGTRGWGAVVDYIRAHPKITEVILSGGDPLLASDNVLADLTQQLADIAHVTLLRIHSRFPIVLPERITPALIDLLSATRLRPVMVTHCNHAQEIDDPVKNALASLQAAGVTLLNQSVLLRGVNDQAKHLIDLSYALFTCRVLPYYLHLMDKVQGAAHFDVSEWEAQQLMREIMGQLPGYLVPRLVKEQPGAPCKIPIPIVF